MKKLFIGDVHGKFGKYLPIIRESEYDTIQVGDFGLGFYQTADAVMFDELKAQNQHRFIRGNHDNPSVCKKFGAFIPDGAVEGNTMYIGGALSIDKADRPAGIDWWEDEQCSYQEMNSFIDLYEKTKPEIMVTHDCPNWIVPYVFPEKKSKGMIKSQTREAFDVMFSLHKPAIHIFGHWHKSVDWTFEGTRFICLNELETVVIDTETLEVIKD